MRYDLAFFLCCCKSFLSSTNDKSTDYYELLEIERDASQDEIKRAFKRQSLQLHPDKLAQRGRVVTEEDKTKFQKMKEAYEVLSDPHKRETYNAIGEKGLKWLEEPFSMDPQEMAQNFASSSTLDRSKIFAIFIGIGGLIFLLPILICLQVDGKLGNASWVAVFTPLWIFDSLVLFYHFRVIKMGPIAKPDGIPDNEWIDPLPMSKRYFSMCRFLLIVLFELLIALKLDGKVRGSWGWVFFPIFLHEATTIYKKFPLARMRIVTIEDLETALGKPFVEFTAAEKELIARKYSVVPAIDTPEFETAHKLKARARQDLIKLVFRVVFMSFIVTQLDRDVNWNWWLVFLPVWVMSFCICCGSFQKFNEVQNEILEKDPKMFATMTGRPDEDDTNGAGSTNYGAMGDKEGAQPEVLLSDQEKDELKSQFLQAGYRLTGSFLSQAFILLIVGLFVGKLQGAGYSAIWIISPLLFIAILILCCLGCTIFCITDIAEEGTEAESQPVGATGGLATPVGAVGPDYTPPLVPHPDVAGDQIADASAAKWDPERGQIWEGGGDNDTGPTVILPPPPTMAVAPTTAPQEVGGVSSEPPPAEPEPSSDLLNEPLLATDKRREESTAIDELD